MNEPSTDDLQFECPLCGGAFEIGVEWLGHEVDCPHCGQGVTLGDSTVETEQPVDTTPTAAQHPMPPEPLEGRLADGDPPPQAPPPAAPEPARRKPLTPAERAAKRTRLNIIFAVVSVVLLVVAFLILTQLG